MKKITIFVLAAVIALSSVFAAFGSTVPVQEQTMNAVKNDSKKVYRKTKKGGKWVYRTSWRNGKKYTKKVWVASKSGTKKAASATKKTTKKVVNKAEDIVN
jgi:hypothetical protein